MSYTRDFNVFGAVEINLARFARLRGIDRLLLAIPLVRVNHGSATFPRVPANPSPRPRLRAEEASCPEKPIDGGFV